MTKVGLGMPGLSIAETRASAQAVAEYNFDSFSVYGDLGDLPPYAVLHAIADILRNSNIKNIGPMGVPVGLQHPEVISLHAVALEEQLPGQTSLGLVRGAFFTTIGEEPATLARLNQTIRYSRQTFAQRGVDIPLYLGGFGPKLLGLAKELDIRGVKLGGSANPDLARRAKELSGGLEIILGSVTVIDPDRKAARQLARTEVAKYLNVVGSLDSTLNGDELASLRDFEQRFKIGDTAASDSISDALLDKFALAGTSEDAMVAIERMGEYADRFEFGTPHGLGDRPTSIRYIGETIVKQLDV
jgi:5,10-methylenetetrahydromethanopterin reductase